MNLSSIFSFKTLSRPAPKSSVFLCTLALAIALRIFLWIRPDAVLFTAEEFDFRAQAAAEMQYRYGDTPNPKVVILGASRLGPVPDEWWPEYFEIPETDIVEVSRPGRTFWHSLSFLRRNPEILSEARVVVMEMLPFQLYRSFTFTEESELFLNDSSLAERMRVIDPAMRAKAVADFLVPAWSERHGVRVWKDAVASTWGGGSALNARLQEEIRFREEEVHQLSMDLGLASFPRLLTFLYTPEPDISQVQIQALYDLCDLIPPDCEMIFAWLPIYSQYETLRSENETVYESDRIFRETLNGLNSPNVSVIWYEDLRADSFLDADFSDGVHYTESGLRKVCALLGKDVRASLAR